MRSPSEDDGAVVVNTTSRASQEWERSLSPFFLGPCRLYDDHESRVLENAWQYSKLYAVHADAEGEPTEAYWAWAEAGWASPKAVRYPMGKEGRPLCSLWDGHGLGYVEARKRIYGPLYVEAVRKTEGWKKLEALRSEGRPIVLRDFDGYDHVALGMSLTDVLNDPGRKMGHAFVLAMMLTQDPGLEQFAPICGR